MAIGGPAILMQPGLRRADDERRRLDRARAQQDVPVRRAGRPGKRGRHREDASPRRRSARERVGKAQIVADRQAEHAERRLEPSPHARPAR